MITSCDELKKKIQSTNFIVSAASDIKYKSNTYKHGSTVENTTAATASTEQPKEVNEFQQKAQNDIARPQLPVQQDLQASTTEMFTKVSKYLSGELATTLADYNLLVQMNNVTSAKYHDMTEITKGLTLYMNDLKIQYEQFQPYIEKINDLDKNVTDLEKTVQVIDEYTKRLENKFKNIDKTALLPINPTPTTTVPPPTTTPK
ncbi:biogenesis of lysosome-related organelles complex-1 [Cavenderia fasciculata]|uniref:Biogenesis of lysosome-related organelles complex-1 n=1 Tax=Cavenderia fasciculata TaxID=261658 RepID=F4Q0J3_CACFS|nr:biogenesis of lysosome-related organelles complex-1 [Cavenderia fasciculata]EGG18344.1 biogenesis of lysosome-related organelles complex-1 [Cavenderia fasciculata]|eukprot:XP_004366248.1 biogenesis of lysosome-related organelles complex-1 [Cavenderia fasciculata]